MTPEDRVLGWDDEISHDGQSQGTLLPPGTYRFEVVNLRRAQHTPDPKKQGKLPACPKAELTVRCYTPDGSDHTDIKHNLFLHSKCEGMLCAFFCAIGQRKHGEPLRPQWNRVVGSRGSCKVGVRDYIVDNEKRQANEIKSFLDPHENGQQKKPSTPPVPPPTSGEGF